MITKVLYALVAVPFLALYSCTAASRSAYTITDEAQIPAPAAYVTMTDGSGAPVQFTAVAERGEVVARSTPQQPGVLLFPGKYWLRVGRDSTIVTVQLISELPKNVDFLASKRSPPRLSPDLLNPVTRNFSLSVTDGRLRRWYNSRSVSGGPFGYGWTFDFGTRLTRSRSGDVEIMEPDGTRTRFVQALVHGAFGEVRRGFTSDIRGALYPSNLYETKGRFWRDIFGDAYFRNIGRYVIMQSFIENGRLRAVNYATGEGQRVEYDGDALKAVIDIRSGKVLFRFETDPSGHIVAMEDAAGRRFRYSYTGNMLAAVTGPDGGITRYRYDDGFNLIEVQYPDQSRETFAYEKNKDWLKDWPSVERLMPLLGENVPLSVRLREWDWLTHMKAPGVDYRFEYGQVKPNWLWTRRIDHEGNVVRWDFRYDLGTTWITSVERLDAKLARALADVGLSDEQVGTPSFPFARVLRAATELGRLGRTGLEAAREALHKNTGLTLPRAKRVLAVLEELRQQRPDLTPGACAILSPLVQQFFGTDGPSIIVRLDTDGREIGRYPFAGQVAAGALTRLDANRVAAADLAPFRYRVLDLSTGSFTEADTAAKAAVRKALPDLFGPRWRSDGTDYILRRIGNRTDFLAIPVKLASGKRGYTVEVEGYAEKAPDLAILTKDSLVLAGRRPDVPVDSIRLADGKIRELGTGPVLTLSRSGDDVWVLYPDRAVQYRRGLKADVTVPLPKDLGIPQGLAPIGEREILVSFIHDEIPKISMSREASSLSGQSIWPGCEADLPDGSGPEK